MTGGEDESAEGARGDRAGCRDPRAALAVATADHACGRRRARHRRLHPRARRRRPGPGLLHIIDAAFGDIGVLSDTLVKATPLILTGLACALAFRMRLWNIGAEGQFLLGAWGASAVVLAADPARGHAGIVVIPAMMLAGHAGRAAWGFIPGLLRARLGVNEIITTLMLNYVALAWIQFWVFGPWSEGGFQQTSAFPREAWLPRLTDFGERVPGAGGLTTHLGLVFALVAAGIMSVVVSRTRWGYEMRLIGDNARAARYAGVDIARYIIVVFVISGALAGLAGMSEVAGVGPSTAGPHLAGLRLHRDHHRLPRAARAVAGGRRLDPVRRADPGRPRDPAVRGPGDDPGRHPVLPDRRRRLRALPGAWSRAGDGRGMIDLTLILAAGVASGTILLFATIGEIFAERAGVLNLGVEGMMLMGAVAGFSPSRPRPATRGSAWSWRCSPAGS